MENFHEYKLTMDSSPSARLERARISLEGLSVGDAFGEGFFMSFELSARLLGSEKYGEPRDFQDDFILREFIGTRSVDHIEKPWRWTDDTALAIETVRNLTRFDAINAEALAIGFCKRYLSNPQRGYGGAMHDLLPLFRFGEWEKFSATLFNGTGSFGNGAAMRSAPIGAYFADSASDAALYAARASQVTHSHPEGIAGGVAIAMAACFAADKAVLGEDLIERVIPLVADGKVKEGLITAQQMSEASVSEAAAALGTGSAVSAQDTVPFCLWCAARNLDNYKEAMWDTVAGLGDRDTTCAIVGGIVAARTGIEGIPGEWLKNRESVEIKGYLTTKNAAESCDSAAF